MERLDNQTGGTLSDTLVALSPLLLFLACLFKAQQKVPWVKRAYSKTTQSCREYGAGLDMVSS